MSPQDLLAMADDQFTRMQAPPSSPQDPAPAPQQVDASTLPLGGRPNDPTRPLLLDPSDDGMATEQSITRRLDGRWVVLPTIVDGQKVSDDDAVRAFRAGENQATGVFRTEKAANSFAEQRHSREEELRYPEEARLRASGNIPTPEERAAKLTPQPWVPRAQRQASK